MKAAIPLEADEEGKFVRQARQLGCLAIKFKDPSRRNAPDRQIMCPGSIIFYIEFKRVGENPRPGQLAYHNMLRRLGFSVWVCYSADEALQILNRCLP
jgi:hypothetical protein